MPFSYKKQEIISLWDFLYLNKYNVKLHQHHQFHLIIQSFTFSFFLSLSFINQLSVLFSILLPAIFCVGSLSWENHFKSSEAILTKTNMHHLIQFRKLMKANHPYDRMKAAK